jgi:hypothetical protein
LVACSTVINAEGATAEIVEEVTADAAIGLLGAAVSAVVRTTTDPPIAALPRTAGDVLSTRLSSARTALRDGAAGVARAVRPGLPWRPSRNRSFARAVSALQGAFLGNPSIDGRDRQRSIWFGNGRLPPVSVARRLTPAGMAGFYERPTQAVNGFETESANGFMR